jgi:hypothetical protein
MVQSSNATRLMRIQARPGSLVEARHYRYPQRGWVQPDAIARGIPPDASADLVFHGSKTVAQMEFQNVFLGGPDRRRYTGVTTIGYVIVVIAAVAIDHTIHAVAYSLRFVPTALASAYDSRSSPYRAGFPVLSSSRFDFNPQWMLVDFGHQQDLALLLFGDLKGVGARDPLAFRVDDQGQGQSI